MNPTAVGPSRVHPAVTELSEPAAPPRASSEPSSAPNDSSEIDIDEPGSAQLGPCDSPPVPVTIRVLTEKEQRYAAKEATKQARRQEKIERVAEQRRLSSQRRTQQLRELIARNREAYTNDTPRRDLTRHARSARWRRVRERTARVWNRLRHRTRKSVTALERKRRHLLTALKHRRHRARKLFGAALRKRHLVRKHLGVLSRKRLAAQKRLRKSARRTMKTMRRRAPNRWLGKSLRRARHRTGKRLACWQSHWTRRARRATYRQRLDRVWPREELAQVLNARQLDGDGVLVGARDGKFAERILSAWSGRMIVVENWLTPQAPDAAELAAVDLSLLTLSKAERRGVPSDDIDRAKSVKRLLDHAASASIRLDRCRAATYARLVRFGARQRIWDASSSDAAAAIDDCSLDFLYLSASDAESITADLALWSPKMRTGGIIAGDRYGTTQGTDADRAIKRAVDTFFTIRGIPVYSTSGHRWLDRVPTWVAEMRVAPRG